MPRYARNLLAVVFIYAMIAIGVFIIRQTGLTGFVLLNVYMILLSLVVWLMNDEI